MASPSEPSGLSGLSGSIRAACHAVDVELCVAGICDALAQAHPDRACLVHRDRELTWAAVRDRTRRLASVLAGAGLGIHGDPARARRWESVHDHVALHLHNGPEYLEGMLGAWTARCAPFNVNYRYVADELCHLLDDASAAAVVVHECFTPVLAEVLPRLAEPPRLVLQVADGSGNGLLDGALDYEDALASADPDRVRGIESEWSGDDLYLCYTGGTTGLPKAAMWRQADFLVGALGVRSRDGTEVDSVDELVDAAAGATLRALPAPPLMHGAAHWNALSCWIAGGTVIIQDHPERFDPDDVLCAVERHGATSLLVVGDPMARPLADRLRAGAHDTSSLRHLLSGGAVLSPQLKAELLDLLPGVRIVDVLGSTESGRTGVAGLRRGDDVRSGFAPSSGAAVLRGDRSGLLAPGDAEVGWLARSGRVPLGYLGDRERTEATFPVVDGVRYAVAGDRARWLADGTIELHGRDSVCINTGGEKVFAEEVETAVKAHPAVLDAVVCGRPSERWGEEVVALVQLRGETDVTDEELLGSAAEHIARFKLPKEVIRLDALVRSPAGKADYRWAKAVAAGAWAGPSSPG